jgi:hypothetical protein
LVGELILPQERNLFYALLLRAAFMALPSDVRQRVKDCVELDRAFTAA